MTNKKLISAITNLCETIEADKLNDEAIELFENVNANSFQMKQWLSKEQMNMASDLYDSDVLDTVQNIIDCFINSLN